MLQLIAKPGRFRFVEFGRQDDFVTNVEVAEATALIIRHALIGQHLDEACVASGGDWHQRTGLSDF